MEADRTGESSPDQDMLGRFDTSVPHPARVYDAWLGGKDNFAADRAAAEAGQQAFPAVVESVRANRAFLARTVEYLAAEAGIRQFLDIGTGLPSADNTHEVAQAVAPESRVVYVDNDPIVLRHAEALLIGKAPGTTAYIDADLRDPDKILAEAARTLDFSQPVAIMLLAVLHFVSDEQDPYKIVKTLLDAVPAGSYLVASHTAKDIRPEQVTPFIQVLNRGLSDKSVSRDRAEVARFFRGLELVEPGVVNISEWRPLPSADAEPAILWGAVARKPGLPQGVRRIEVSWAREATSRPAASDPRRCRAAGVRGLRCQCQGQSSARNGWWNHTAWWGAGNDGRVSTATASSFLNGPGVVDDHEIPGRGSVTIT